MAGHPAPAAALRLETLGGHALHVAPLGDADQHGLVGHQVLLPQVFLGFGSNARAARVAVFLGQLVQVILDQIQDLARLRQQFFQVSNVFQKLALLILDFLAFQGSQAAKLHIQDCLGLDLAQTEALYQALLGHIRIRRFADGLDHIVQVRQRDEQALQDVSARPGFVQLEFRAAGDHLAAVFDINLQSALERKQARLTSHQRQELHPIGGLQRRVLV